MLSLNNLINKMVGAVSKKIFEIKPDSCIYTEDVEQEFEEGSFIIRYIKTDFKNLIGKRKDMQNSFVIHYFRKR